MKAYINFKDSVTYHLPINCSRAPQIGDILRFTGNIHPTNFRGRTCEKLVFEEVRTGEVVEMSINTLMKANGTVRNFMSDFDTVGDVLERAIKAKVEFIVSDQTVKSVCLATGETINHRLLTIHCQN